MKGKVLDYNLQDNGGIILADDGNRYNFTNSHWKSNDTMPQKNVELDFVIEGENAIDIYATKSEKRSNQHITIQTTQTSAAAVTSMIFGIIGLFLDWWLFALPSIVAIITGHIAKANIAASNGTLSGSGMATAGLILGYVVILIYLSVVFIFAGLLASIATM